MLQKIKRLKEGFKGEQLHDIYRGLPWAWGPAWEKTQRYLCDMRPQPRLVHSVQLEKKSFEVDWNQFFCSIFSITSKKSVIHSSNDCTWSCQEHHISIINGCSNKQFLITFLKCCKQHFFKGGRRLFFPQHLFSYKDEAACFNHSTILWYPDRKITLGLVDGSIQFWKSSV